MIYVIMREQLILVSTVKTAHFNVNVTMLSNSIWDLIVSTNLLQKTVGNQIYFKCLKQAHEQCINVSSKHSKLMIQLRYQIGFLVWSNVQDTNISYRVCLAKRINKHQQKVAVSSSSKQQQQLAVAVCSKMCW